MKKVLLVDGSSLLFRGYYAMPPLTTKDGFTTNAMLGFLNMLLKAIADLDPGYVGVFFDLKGGSFRNELYPEYKGTRKETDEELLLQFPATKEVLSSMGIFYDEKQGFEADDLIGTAADFFAQKGAEVTVLTGDRDLLQLVGPKTSALITLRGVSDMQTYTLDNTEKQLGYRADQVIEYKGLAGDASDNIPGVSGVGKKTATDLLKKYDTIEEIYKHLEDLPTRAKNALKDNEDMAYLSRQLATIKRDVDVDYSFETFAYDPEVKDLSMLKKYELNSLVKRFEDNDIDLDYETSDDLSLIDKTKELFYDEIIYQGKTLRGYYQGKHMVVTTSDELLDFKGICFNANEIFYRWAKQGQPFFELVDDLQVMENLIFPDKNILTLEEADDESILPKKSTLLKKQEIDFDLAQKALSDLLGKRLFVIGRLYKSRKKMLEENELTDVYEEIEKPLIPVIVSMELAGFRVDEEKLDEMDLVITKRVEDLAKQIQEMAGETFNVNSPKQLGDVLFEKLKLPVIRKTKTGYSTSKDVLDKLEDEHEIIKVIKDYRAVAKLKSTYIDGLRNVIRDDGKVHSTFHQTYAATGRLSSSEPNLQNIPIRLEGGRKIRKIFVPEDDNHILISADYSQIELRVLAHISEDKALIEGFKQGEDIHRMTAAKVFDVDIDKVTYNQRRDAKAVNFGIVYGISDYGLSENLDIDRKDAKDYIETYFEQYPGIKQYMEDIVEQCKEQGYVSTLGGRRRHFPAINSRNFHQRNYARRSAINTPIQGSAADIIKIAMIKVNKRLKAEGLKSQLILQVHDELMIDALKSEQEQIKALLKEEMESAFELKVPLVVDMKEGQSWFDAD